MLDRTDDIAASAAHWLAEFERALETSDERALRPLFLPESYWRDAAGAELEAANAQRRRCDPESNFPRSPRSARPAVS